MKNWKTFFLKLLKAAFLEIIKNCFPSNYEKLLFLKIWKTDFLANYTELVMNIEI